MSVLDIYIKKENFLNIKLPSCFHFREFQEMAGLRITGELNKATVRKMKSPRCGLPDVIKPRDRIAPDVGRSKNPNEPLQFNAPGKQN